MLLLGGWLAACVAAQPEIPAPAPVAKAPTVHTATVTSKSYKIDKMYGSMRGPYGFDDVRLTTADPPELLWIVGYRSVVVDARSEQPMSQEFMCHANLDFESSDYYDRFPKAPPISGRVFTLSQGQQEIRFPEGFGIPVTSDLPISLATQVLNLNMEKPDLDVRHKVDVLFVRDAEVEGQMIPLFQAAAEGFKALGDARYYGVSADTDIDEAILGSACSVGAPAVEGDSDDDALGQKFTAHWLVKPGREINTTNVTRFMNLPYDTTAHYIAVHLHPFAESLTLRDVTTNQVMFAADVTPATGRVGIESIQHFESVEGMRLFKDHEYELTSVYDNTSGRDVDSMAVMYLYLRDLKFQKPGTNN